MFDENITPYQNLTMLILVSFAFQSMLMPLLLSEIDGPVGWITIIIAAFILYLAIKPINKMLLKYREDTLIGISDKIFPKFIAKIIGIYYIVMLLTANSILMKDFAEQIKQMMLFKTPLSSIIIVILLTTSYATKKGIKTIANIASVTLLIAFIPYLLLIIFSTYYADYSNLFPVYPMDAEGILKSVPGAILGFFGFSILMFSNCKVTVKEKNTMINKRFIIISTILYVASYILIIVKFGIKESVHLVWPFLSVMKFVNIPGFFFESTEIIGLCFQFIITASCICIIAYFTNLTMQETFKTRENGYFIYIQMPILFVLSALLPGMYMMFPYIQLPLLILSGLNFLIPLVTALADKKLKRPAQLLILIVCLLLTGCWDSAEINKREYLYALGIDKNPQNLTFTAEIPKINEGSEEQRIVYSEDSADFAGFYAASYLHSEKVISDRLMQEIVLGEDVARDSEAVKRIFDEIQRSPQINRRVKICIAKGRAQDIINTEIPGNPIVGRFLSDMLVKLKRENYQDVYTFDEAILDMGKTGNAMIPVVEINDKSLMIERAGVIKEYALKGFLEPEEVATVMVLLNPEKAKIPNININAEGTNISLGVVDLSMTKDFKLDNDKLKADYYITMYIYINSFITGSNKLEDQSYLNKIKDEASKSFLTVAEKTVDKLQHTYSADILKIKDNLYKYHKGDYEKIMDKYDEIFETADINIHLDLKIKSTGLVK